MNYRIYLFSTLIVFLGYIDENSTDPNVSIEWFCANEQCSEPISTGISVVKYIPDKSEKVHLTGKDNIKILKKPVNKKLELWYIEVNGKKGYASFKLLKELSLKVKSDNLVKVTSVIDGNLLGPDGAKVLNQNNLPTGFKTPDNKPNGPQGVSNPDSITSEKFIDPLNNNETSSLGPSGNSENKTLSQDGKQAKQPVVKSDGSDDGTAKSSELKSSAESVTNLPDNIDQVNNSTLSEESKPQETIDAHEDNSTVTEHIPPQINVQNVDLKKIPESPVDDKNVRGPINHNNDEPKPQISETSTLPNNINVEKLPEGILESSVENATDTQPNVEPTKKPVSERDSFQNDENLKQSSQDSVQNVPTHPKSSEAQEIHTEPVSNPASTQSEPSTKETSFSSPPSGDQAEPVAQSTPQHLNDDTVQLENNQAGQLDSSNQPGLNPTQKQKANEPTVSEPAGAEHLKQDPTQSQGTGVPTYPSFSADHYSKQDTTQNQGTGMPTYPSPTADQFSKQDPAQSQGTGVPTYPSSSADHYSQQYPTQNQGTGMPTYPSSSADHYSKQDPTQSQGTGMPTYSSPSADKLSKQDPAQSQGAGVPTYPSSTADHYSQQYPTQNQGTGMPSYPSPSVDQFSKQDPAQSQGTGVPTYPSSSADHYSQQYPTQDQGTGMPSYPSPSAHQYSKQDPTQSQGSGVPTYPSPSANQYSNQDPNHNPGTDVPFSTPPGDQYSSQDQTQIQETGMQPNPEVRPMETVGNRHEPSVAAESLSADKNAKNLNVDPSQNQKIPAKEGSATVMNNIENDSKEQPPVVNVDTMGNPDVEEVGNEPVETVIESPGENSVDSDVQGSNGGQDEQLLDQEVNAESGNWFSSIYSIVDSFRDTFLSSEVKVDEPANEPDPSARGDIHTEQEPEDVVGVGSEVSSENAAEEPVALGGNGPPGELLSNAHCDKEEEMCKSVDSVLEETDKNYVNIDPESYSVSFGILDKWSADTILLLIITAVVVLLFSLGHYYIEYSRRDGDLVAKINSLEGELFVMKKEQGMVDDQLMKSRDSINEMTSKLTEQEVFVTNLLEELEESKVKNSTLEDTISRQEKEIEMLMENGLEMHRLLSETISDEDRSQILLSNIAELKESLTERLNENISLTEQLDQKNQEIQLLKLDVKSSVDKQHEVEQKLINAHRDIEDRILQATEPLKEQIMKLEQNMAEKASEHTRLEAELAQRKCESEKWEARCVSAERGLRDAHGVRSSDAFNKWIDAAQVRADLKASDIRAQALQEEKQALITSTADLEGKIKDMRQEMSQLNEKYEMAEKGKIEALTQLQVLSNYFKEKETQLQEELGLKEALWLQKQSEGDTIYEQMRALREENLSYRSQNEMLKKEVLEQEASLKKQITAEELKAHENWVALRQAERRLKEVQMEAAQLRNRLTVLESSANHSGDGQLSPNGLEPNGESPYPGAGSPPFMLFPREFMPPPPLSNTTPTRPPPLGRISSPPLSVDFTPPPPIMPFDLLPPPFPPPPAPVPAPPPPAPLHKPQPRDPSHREQKESFSSNYSSESTNDKPARRGKR